MDIKFTQKQTIKQKDYLVSGKFEVYPEFSEDDKYIENIDLLLDDVEDLKQGVTFATLKQKGSDPLDEEEGNRWSEVFLGELPVFSLMADIKNSVHQLSGLCEVEFYTETDEEGNEYLAFENKVVL